MAIEMEITLSWDWMEVKERTTITMYEVYGLALWIDRNVTGLQRRSLPRHL
ncbi:MAG: hypothetical protein EBE86_014985 [Hormoscilla sp. GUM202]|nr:hypothetical protein [Hormoscilla sp. GUM202]